MPAAPSRVPSYGPNGTHWPGQLSGVITPFMYDETVPNRIEVACSWSAIIAAVGALTTTQVNAGVLILVQPGTLVGLGGSSSDPAVFNNLGNRSWSKRVTICPRDGFGSVRVTNGTKMERVKMICLAGFVFEGRFRFRNSVKAAIAWSIINGNMAFAGESTVEADQSGLELVEVVKQDVKRGDPTDPMQHVYPEGQSGHYLNLFYDGVYIAPNYMPEGHSAHQDTIQHLGQTNRHFSGVMQDSVVFGSNRCAINGGLTNFTFRNCWLNGKRSNQMPRYPDGGGGVMSSSADLSQGSKSNLTFDGGVYMGGLKSNTGADSRPYRTVLNGAKIDYQPSGSSAPVNGTWVVDTSLNGHTNPGYPPLPTDAFLSNIWGGSYEAPVGQTSQPSFDRSGTYYQATVLQISSPTAGAAIYYTTNGDTPTASSTLYTGPITVNATTTFKAIAIGAEPLEPSNVVTATITITNDLLSSTAWQNIPLASNLTSDFSVTWRTTPSAANMDSITGLSAIPASAYTQLPIIVRFNPSNGFDARNGSAYAVTNAVPYTPGTEYEVQVDVNFAAKTYDVTITPRPGGVAGTPVLLADNFAFRTEANTTLNLANLAMVSATGTHTLSNVEIDAGTPPLPVAAAPTFSTVQPGNYATPQTVTLATTEPDSTIRYTIGGGDVPTDGVGGFLYLGPIGLGNATLTIKARTFAADKQPSVQLQGTFGVETVVVTPQIAPVEASPGPFTFPSGSPPTITASTPVAGASIYYTLNGVDPTASSTLYNAPIALPNATTTVKLIAIKAGMTNSPVATYLYQLQPVIGPPTVDDTSTPPTDPTPGATEILTPQIYLARARFFSKITLTNSATLAFGGLATEAASREEDVIAGWKLNGTHWQVLSGSSWVTTSTPVQAGIWEVRIEVKQRTYSIYLREEGDTGWNALGTNLPMRFRAAIDRTVYKSTLHPLTVREVSSQPFKILLLGS